MGLSNLFLFKLFNYNTFIWVTKKKEVNIIIRRKRVEVVVRVKRNLKMTNIIKFISILKIIKIIKNTRVVKIIIKIIKKFNRKTCLIMVENN